jgi:hypothetical protein
MLYEAVEPYAMRVPNIDCHAFYIESFYIPSPITSAITFTTYKSNTR